MQTIRRRTTLTLLLLGSAALTPAPAVAQEESRLVPETFEGLALRGIGPALMSGRIADIAIDPGDRSTWYVAVGSGGVWKTTNAGTTWTSVFDGQGSYSIGCVAVDPNRPTTVWVGSGENGSGRHAGFGDGVYRSLDGGGTWENMGLRASERIGSIRIDPRDSDVVYVAAQGPLWSGGGERGVYKTEDGGATWALVLAGANEYTGANEVVLDPNDPDVLYAAMHQRQRNVAALIDGGPGSGIHKSTDGGATWRELTAGLPDEDLGKIGLALAPQDSQVLYATIELAHRGGGFYRSVDGGASWEQRNDSMAGGTGPHYYQELWASPHSIGRVYQAGPRMLMTEDGGASMHPMGEEFKHGDNHAMAFDPDDPEYLLVGSDGGIYESFDLGATWKFAANLPVTQFYKVAVDYDEPFYNVYGGTQDNNTQGGPSRTVNVNGIRNADWFITLYADGHQPAVDPTNPDIVYSEWQEGNLVRYDRRTGEIVYIQPQPAEDEPWDRFNWDAPILISSHDPARLFYASQRVWRSDDRGDSWTPLSGDLSRGEDRLRQPLMGRVWSYDAIWDLYAMSKYATITSLAESPVDERVLYAGTDDGLIQVSEDGGASWRRIDALPGVEARFFVNDIKADLFDASTVYVCVDHHKDGDFKPYVLMSTDRGRSWRSIAGDLPDRHLVWRLVQDEVNPELLFVGTEFGVFFTVDGGGRWVKLGGNAPTIPFRDLAIQRREHDLVGATFGRGFWILDDYTPLRTVSAELLEQEAHLFEVRDAWWYVERRPLGQGEKASQGHAYFTAPNPPFGAVFTYYLRDELKTAAELRKEREQSLSEAGGDTPTPGWEALLEEAWQDEPAVVFTVRDAGGEVVRTLRAPAGKGLQRISWDLRGPTPSPWREGEGEDEDGEDSGSLVLPGRYVVTMATVHDGVTRGLGEPRTFEVKRLPVEPALTRNSLDTTAAFLARLDRLQRQFSGALASVDEALVEVGAIRDVIARSATEDASLDGEARRIQRRLRELRETLRGNDAREMAGDPGPVSVQRRLSVATTGTGLSTYGPTPNLERSVDIGEAGLNRVRVELQQLVVGELEALHARLRAAGLPWSPGR